MWYLIICDLHLFRQSIDKLNAKVNHVAPKKPPAKTLFGLQDLFWAGVTHALLAAISPAPGGTHHTTSGWSKGRDPSEKYI